MLTGTRSTEWHLSTVTGTHLPNGIVSTVTGARSTDLHFTFSNSKLHVFCRKTYIYFIKVIFCRFATCKHNVTWKTLIRASNSSFHFEQYIVHNKVWRIKHLWNTQTIWHETVIYIVNDCQNALSTNHSCHRYWCTALNKSLSVNKTLPLKRRKKLSSISH